MTGTDKLKPLVIGKFAKPRCFKSVKSLPVIYRANKKAWITSDIYEQWLRDLNKSMMKQKRKIVLFVDNCPAHPQIDRLSNVKVVFLPPNTTSQLQPLDQGMIWNFKMNYRRLIVNKLLDSHENKAEFEMNVYNAIVFIHRAWRNETLKTIENCFAKAGSVKRASDDEPSDNDDDDNDDDVPLAFLQCNWLCVVDTETSDLDFEQYVSVDNSVTMAEQPDDDEILSSVLNKKSDKEQADNCDSDDEDDDDAMVSDTLIIPAVNRESACDSLTKLRIYIDSQENVNDRIYDSLSDLETFLCQRKFVRQTTINDFFNRH